MLKTLKQAKPIFIYGLTLVAALVIIQLLLDALQNSFLLYMPPIGFAFFLFTQYGIQPIALGALNVVILRRLYKCEEWQTGFWLNGVFLLLTFTTINVILETITGLSYAPYIALIDILILPFLFGHLGKFSNRPRKTVNTQQPAIASVPQETPCQEPPNKQ